MSSNLPSVEKELAHALVVGNPEVERIAQLVREVSWEAFTRELYAQRLLVLLGQRLVRLDQPGVPDDFARLVAKATTESRERSRLFEVLSIDALTALEAAGVRAIPLKGPIYSAWLHGDSGIRISTDIDILVAGDSMFDAIRVLAAQDWLPPVRPFVLPRLHHHLRRRDGGPVLELHWRAHWYEGRFSTEMIKSSKLVGGLRRPDLAHEFILLMALYARDGMAGLRWLSDLGAWWQQNGESVDPPTVSGILEHHPELGRAVSGAALAVERLTGLPTSSLVDPLWVTERRVRLAARVADWTVPASETAAGVRARVTNMLLCPDEQLMSQAIREYLPPLPSGGVARRLAHGIDAIQDSVGVLWSLRAGRSMNPTLRPGSIAHRAQA